MEKSTPLLVLLPGLDGSGLLFERFLAELPPEFRTLIIPYPDDCGTTMEEHAAVARNEKGDRFIYQSFFASPEEQLLSKGGQLCQGLCEWYYPNIKGI
jgi:hypothetical protein